MSDDFDPDLERELRAAHHFEPRAGLEAEIRAGLRPRRALPWAGLGAAAAAVVAALGLGLLLHQSAPQPQANGGEAAPNFSSATFGKLPAPVFGQRLAAASPAGQDKLLAPTPALPPSAPVYAWSSSATSESACPQPASPTLDGYPVVGISGQPQQPFGCLLQRPLPSALYSLKPATPGSRLVYIGVPAGRGGYFEPAYQLPDGTIETALTPDELRG